MNHTLTIMVGCQGSGKSTWAKSNRAAAKYCSADNYFIVDGVYKFDITKLGIAHGTCFRDAVESARVGCSVVIDNTNGSIVEIAPYYALGQAYGMRIEIVKMICSPETGAKRNAHGVSLSVVKNTSKKINNLFIPPYWKITQTEVFTEDG